MNCTQQDVLDILNNSLESIFLTGNAGTGKTYVLKQWISSLDDPSKIILSAPTGIAAMNMGGQTLHRIFQIPFQFLDIEHQAHVNSFKFKESNAQLLREAHALIIDEVSMVHADVLTYIDITLQKILGSTEPFGGLRIILVGDPYQLPPVEKDRAKEPSSWFFMSTSFQRLAPIPMNLTKSFRQESGPFLDILNGIRVGRVTQAQLNLLNSQSSSPTHDPIRLCATNQYVEDHNLFKLSQLLDEEFIFEMDIHNYAIDYKIENNIIADKILRLKVNAKVLFINNDQNNQWVNGTTGVVKDINFDQKLIKVTLDSGVTVDVKPYRWKSEELTRVGEEYSSRLLGEATQFPLKLGWAITIHKSQGLTFDSAAIVADKIFANGQAYVALSRIKTLEGLYMVGKLLPRHLMVSPQVKTFFLTYVQKGVSNG